jgi:hypothetical protein
VSIHNCVDLSLLARSVDNEQWKGRYSNPIGLARLVEAYEDRQLSKGKTSWSDWQSILSSTQQECLSPNSAVFFCTHFRDMTDASNDAHAAYVIYTKLIMSSQSMTTIPKSVYYTFDAVRGRLCEPSGMYWSAFNPDYDPGPLPPRNVDEQSPYSATGHCIPPKLPSALVVTKGSYHGLRRSPSFR